MDSLVTELTAQIGAATPVIAAIFAAFIGVAFLVALGFFAMRRARGAVK